MTRLLRFTGLALFTLIFTMTAFAQDAMPLPGRADVLNTRAAITLIQPAVFGGITPTTIFKWSDIGAKKTILVFRMVNNGQVFKWTPVISCNGTVCQTQNLPGALFDMTSDSSVVDWSVVSTLNGIKHKSEKRRLTVEEVTAPTPLTPYHQQQLPVISLNAFTWEHPATAAKYQFILKDYDTGAVIVKQGVNVATSCWDSVPYDRCQWQVTPGLLQANHHYVWWLVVTGVTGEKATSAKFNVLTK